ncbi:FtsW/RodA/SpoVE family cell cycle protein [Mesobacillus selenatarsenatis]|uniref:Cell division protein FtsW n=1 Tax=Mesobacillus selenatarsenatis (strain DSM 18680 / JCM 14380 / FERM P-15431 / SF-1) TaxID=1321606 RepID=A0A0A8WXU2_MESS1|nr:FtsW/RodA/SpoVE family cell cycle protein [Mesobacillus selenatarsenatis]GAM12433.1 cell division protein FtsW [Mesobacillus selenatarsenatis SF-1]
MNNRWDYFLSEVTNHIRSKEAKKYVASELEYHLNEVKKEWVGKGLSEREAEEKAVSQMGSPSKLGHELNKLHKPRIDWWLIGLLAITMALSFLPLITLGDELSDGYLVMKAIHVLLGVMIAAAMMFIDYRKLENKGWVYYSIGVLFLFLLLTIPNAIINGVPYFMIGPFQMESHYALPFLFLGWASFFNNPKIKLWQRFLLFALPLLLLMAVPNLAVSFIYMVMIFIMMWWSTFSRKTATLITITSIMGVAAFSTFAWFTVKEYQLARILGFLNPEKYPDSWGYMYLQLKERLSSAGWFGSAVKTEALPFEHTDYAFVNLTYHYGYSFGIGLFVILSLFAARIVMISTQINTRFGNLLLVGGVTLFLVQFIYNVGMMIGLLPLTSMSLPFISYGFIPMLFNAFIMGVVLSVYRRKDIKINRAA